MRPAATPTHVDSCGWFATRIRRCGPGVRQGMLDIVYSPATWPVQLSDSDCLESGAPGGSGARPATPPPLVHPAAQLGQPAEAAAARPGPLPPARRHGRNLAGLQPYSTTWRTSSLFIITLVIFVRFTVLINEYMTHLGMDVRRQEAPAQYRPIDGWLPASGCATSVYTSTFWAGMVRHSYIARCLRHLPASEYVAPAPPPCQGRRSFWVEHPSVPERLWWTARTRRILASRLSILLACDATAVRLAAFSCTVLHLGPVGAVAQDIPLLCLCPCIPVTSPAMLYGLVQEGV